MPRKRGPFLINGAPVELDAPGLERRRGGQLYWVCSKEARRAGYTPRTVPMFADQASLTEMQEVARRCRVLQAEMANWLADPDGQSRPVYDGTVRALLNCYETDPSSPYQDLEHSTQACYSQWGRALVAVAGARRVDRATGNDVRKWFTEILKPPEIATAGRAIAPRVRLARGAVRQLLPVVLSYGAENMLPGCLPLLQVVERMTLRVPRDVMRSWKAARPPKAAMTFQQAEAIVSAGLSSTWGVDRSVAIGVAAQFELTLSQIDVIGSWHRISNPKALPAGAIVKGGKLWRPGLTFEQIESGLLDLARSKTSVEATFKVDEYPLFMRAVAAVPADQRSGALVKDLSGFPLQKRYYASRYAALARAAKVPPNVWNMRARHGGLTEGYNAIVKRKGRDAAALADLKIHGQHTRLDTTLDHYVVGGVDATKRVARARVADRKVRAAK